MDGSHAFTFGQFELFPDQRLLLRNGQELRLGGRALALLVALVERAGEIVSRDELMAAAWPRTVVDEANVRVHIAALRKTLGEDVTVPGFIVNVPGRGYRFVAPLAARSEPLTPTSEASPFPATCSLPRQLVRVIGRSVSTEKIVSKVIWHRLVTIAGPGGIGKTTVALEVAASLAARFGDQVVFVDLTSATEDWMVPDALASALGHSVNSDDPTAELVALFQNTKFLVLLDNCEHVVGAAARLAEALIRAPGVHVLATSREVLRVDGEWVHRLGPLDLPPENDVPKTLADALLYPALELFVERASYGGYVLTDADAPLIAEICRKVDGIALAIEFAVGRVDTMGLHGLADSLGDCMRVLTHGRRTALPRHQTLRATLDWSYSLLSEPERTVLRRLSIFVGTFTLEAAEAITAGGAIDSVQTVAGVVGLVAKSLVVVDTDGPAARYRLLDTIRAYALEKLNDSGEAPSCARRHAEYIRDLLRRAGSEWQARPEDEWMADYGHQIGNLRAALDWGFGPGGDDKIGVALTVAAVPVWLHLSHLVECRERVSQALARPGLQASVDVRIAMQLHIALGLSLLYTTGLVTQTEEALATGLRLAQYLNDLDNELIALWALWYYHMGSGELRTAEPLAEQFLTVGDQTADYANRLLGDQIIGATMHFSGNQPAARGYLERVLAVPESPGKRRHAAWILSHVRMPAQAMRARVLLLQGLVEQASHSARVSFDDEAAHGHELTICTILRYAVCHVAFALSDLTWAETSVQMLNDLAAKHASAFWSRIGRCLEGALLIKRGDLAAGTAILQQALATVRNRPPDLLAVLAEGQAGLGAFRDAVATIDERLVRSNQTAERWCDPELLRIKGELMLQWGADNAESTAEVCLESAIDLARNQGALFWELRAALGLARFKLRQLRPHDARLILAPVFGRFTEGFETADLRSARALLGSL